MVLNRLKNLNFVVNEEKSKFDVASVVFLGHVIDGNGIRPEKSKVEAIKRFRKPKTIAELQSFLGLATYVGKFVPHLSTLTTKLRDLIKTNSLATWNQDHDKALIQIKESLSDETHLGFFDPKDRTQLIVDASPTGLGAVLIQISRNGIPRIIAYASKSLSEVEKCYCQFEKEALAVVWGMERFSVFLLWIVFDLLTDCKALEFLFSAKSTPCARIQRWVLRIQCFNYRIIHLKGKYNIADPLSRLSISEETSDISGEVQIRSIIEEHRPMAVTWDEIVASTQEDPELLKVKEAIESEEWEHAPLHYKVIKDELCIYNGIILRQDKIVIPVNLRSKILKLGHEGHPGITGMKNRLRAKVWFHNMNQEIEKHVKMCKSCVMTSLPDPPNPICPRKPPDRPWTDVSVDYKTGLPSGMVLFVVVDYYSRFIEYAVLKPADVESTIEAIFHMFARWGLPKVIHADNGGQFMAKVFSKFCEEHDIMFNSGPPWWPQANGQVERQNRNLVRRIQIAHAEKKDWQREIAQYVMMFHNLPHPATGVPPSNLMINRNLREKIPSLEAPPEPNGVRDHEILYKEKMKNYTNKKRHAKWSCLEEGDTVLLKNHYKKSKLEPNFGLEEYIIKKKQGAEVIVESKTNPTKQFRRNTMDCKKLLIEDENMEKDEKENQEAEEEDMNILEIPQNNADTDNEIEEVEATEAEPKKKTPRPQRLKNKPKHLKDDFILY